MAGERRRKCGWNGNDGKVEVCSEAREKERERKRVRESEKEGEEGRVERESGTTRWHPNKSKIAGTLYRQCWYCNVLNDASREENVREREKERWEIFRGIAIAVPAVRLCVRHRNRPPPVFRDVHFPVLPGRPPRRPSSRERLLFDDCSGVGYNDVSPIRIEPSRNRGSRR